MHLIGSFPWPPKELNPNARVHHMAKARIAKKYRETCHLMALSMWGGLARAMKVPERKNLHIWLTFEVPDNRKRDDDNLIAAFKPGRDGIADALKVDDSAFALHVVRGMKHKGGRVKVAITDRFPDDTWSWGDPWPNENNEQQQ